MCAQGSRDKSGQRDSGNQPEQQYLGHKPMTERTISDSSNTPGMSASISVSLKSSKKIDWRLHKHADYQRVYRTGRRQSLPLLTYFFSMQTEVPSADIPAPAEISDTILGPRIGLTTGRVLGKAVERNRIKRRMREAVRRNLGLLSGPVDVVLHPRRSVLDAEFAAIERDVARAFQAVQRAITRPATEVAGQNAVAERDQDAGAAGK